MNSQVKRVNNEKFLICENLIYLNIVEIKLHWASTSVFFIDENVLILPSPQDLRKSKLKITETSESLTKAILLRVL